MISVIIPVRNEGANLWYTLHQLKIMQDHSMVSEEMEILVVDSGSSDGTKEFVTNPTMSKWVKYLPTSRTGPGPVRQAGAEQARGDIFFFLDGHVLLSPNFFTRACQAIREELWDTLGSLHFPIAWDGGLGNPMSTTYELTLDKNFWGNNLARHYDELSEVCAGGHAAVAVRRDHFQEIRGYSAPFRNYGGDETYLDLKFALWNYRNYILPDTYYLHCSQRRQAYTWTNDDLFINNIMSAYVIGGSAWSQKVLAYTLEQPHWTPGEVVLKRHYLDALILAQEDHEFVQQNKKRSLEDVLEDFKARGIFH